MNPSTQRSGGSSVALVFSRFGPYHLARIRAAAAALAETGHSLAAISIAGSDRTYAWNRVESPEGCRTHLLFPDAVYEGLSEAAIEWRLTECLRAIQPAAVALPGWAFAEARAGLRWCGANKAGAVLMSESSYGDHYRLWPREILKKWMVGKFHAALVGGSRHADYAMRLGIPRAAIFNGYDAVDNEYFSTGADRVRASAANVRAQHRLPEHYLLSSSRFISKKNIDGLLRGYARYRATTQDARDLVLCGDGEQGERLKALARKLGVDAHVHWPGFVQYPDLPAYYGLADAFILASTIEPWGLVVNEAMASGLPVLVSNRCGSAPDLVVEGETGFTFDPDDPEAIAAAIRKIPADVAGRVAMGTRARARIDKWSPRHFGLGLLEASRMALARLGREDLGLPRMGAME